MGNSVMLVVFGIVDIVLELFGMLWCGSQGSDLDSKMVVYASIGLDIIKMICVLGGFVVRCMVADGATKEFKEKIGSGISICEAIIAFPAIFLGIFIVSIIFAGHVSYIDMRGLEVLIFLGYFLLKAATFYGYFEFLRSFVNDVPIVKGGFEFADAFRAAYPRAMYMPVAQPAVPQMPVQYFYN